MQAVNISNLLCAALLTLGFVSANTHAQQVALLDSGVDPGEGLNIGNGFNYYLNTDDTSDVSDREGAGHGTTSARAVSESFNGPIIPFVVNDGAASVLAVNQSRVARDNALSDILGRDQVRVVGITAGVIGVTGSSAALIPELSNANKVIAIMAGNGSANQPNSLATSSFNLAGVIIVGGTDADGRLLSNVNKAGTTANKYVATIGLPSPIDGATVGGSSWATARISGIAGAVLQQNPDLTAAEVVDVILRSAEDVGETGTDSVYGRGFIRNAKQVLDNVIGPVVVPTESGGGGSGGAALVVGAALAGAILLLRKPRNKLEKTLVLDSYGRTFQLDLGQSISVNENTLPLNQFFQSLDNPSISSGFLLPNLKTEVAFGAVANEDYQLELLKQFAMPNDVVFAEQQANMSFALATQLSESLDLTAGYQVSPSQAFGAISFADSNPEFGASSFISGQAFSSVLSGFSPQAQTASLSYRSGKASTKVGLVSVNQSQQFGQDSFSTIVQGGYDFTDNVGLSLQFGQIEENGSLFGGASGGPFGVDQATTYAINLSGRIKTNERFSIIANYGVGHTSVDAGQNSLLKGFSSLKSDWYSIGLIGNNVFHDQDQFGLAFSQPLKIRSGSLNYSIPTHRASNGLIAFDSERVDLAKTNATEHNIEAYYRARLSKKMELGAFVSYRQNPNHVSDYGDDVLLMTTFKYH